MGMQNPKPFPPASSPSSQVYIIVFGLNDSLSEQAQAMLGNHVKDTHGNRVTHRRRILILVVDRIWWSAALQNYRALRDKALKRQLMPDKHAQSTNLVASR